MQIQPVTRPLIHDGFNESSVFGGVFVQYRPTTHQFRAGLESYVSQFGESWLFAFAESRIVWCPQSFTMTIDIASELIGIGNHVQEDADSKELRLRVSGYLRNPKLHQVSCETCRAKWFDPIDGTFTNGPDGPLDREGETLCEFSDTCPIGHYNAQKRLNGKWLQAFNHFMRCEATTFPDDPIVARNAIIIRGAIHENNQRRGGKTDGGAKSRRVR